jgi:hypothetical protein
MPRARGTERRPNVNTSAFLKMGDMNPASADDAHDHLLKKNSSKYPVSEYI